MVQNNHKGSLQIIVSYQDDVTIIFLIGDWPSDHWPHILLHGEGKWLQQSGPCSHKFKRSKEKFCFLEIGLWWEKVCLGIEWSLNYSHTLFISLRYMVRVRVHGSYLSNNSECRVYIVGSYGHSCQKRPHRPL